MDKKIIDGQADQSTQTTKDAAPAQEAPVSTDAPLTKDVKGDNARKANGQGLEAKSQDSQNDNSFIVQFFVGATSENAPSILGSHKPQNELCVANEKLNLVANNGAVLNRSFQVGDHNFLLKLYPENINKAQRRLPQLSSGEKEIIKCIYHQPGKPMKQLPSLLGCDETYPRNTFRSLMLRAGVRTYEQLLFTLFSAQLVPSDSKKVLSEMEFARFKALASGQKLNSLAQTLGISPSSISTLSKKLKNFAAANKIIGAPIIFISMMITGNLKTPDQIEEEFGD
ncbi:MAG: hypothetical protein LBT38_07350 [Deltaproteobacteria bacterium]|jgi:hypothetical protein|nr:hypothetical protein [Deltaproteobacteria bacterium]